MVHVKDVAKYILQKHGDMSAMKLQKLVYYCQAWHMVWAEKPLFAEEFQAWANGPVCRELYEAHKGQFMVTPQNFADGDVNRLHPKQRKRIDKVVQFYGDKTAQWLSNLSHREDPWRDAREGLEPGDSSTNVITKASMHEYYSSL
jgi:uncharacterized phage-associated protein